MEKFCFNYIPTENTIRLRINLMYSHNIPKGFCKTKENKVRECEKGGEKGKVEKQKPTYPIKHLLNRCFFRNLIPC